MSKKVLVTGGCGYIGSVVVEKLLAARTEDDEPVYHLGIIDNLMNVPWAVDALGGVAYCTCDLEHEDALKFVEEFDPEVIIHLAAFAYVGESMWEPGHYWHNNVKQMVVFVERILGRCRPRCKVVFASSCAVYGNANPYVRENSPKNPVNTYGRTKLAGEWLLDDLHRAEVLDFVNLRLFNVAGASALNGERHFPETHLLPNLIYAALGIYPQATIYGETCVRDYVHVEDVADAFIRAAAYLMDDQPSISLNIASGSGTSIRECIDMVEAIEGTSVPVNVEPPRAGDVPTLIARTDKAAAALGWAPHHSELPKIIRSVLDWLGTPAGHRHLHLVKEGVQKPEAD